MPNRQQAIIWTSANLIPSSIYVAVGGNELQQYNFCSMEIDYHWMKDVK